MNYANAASKTPATEDDSNETTKRPRTLFLKTTQHLDFPRMLEILKNEASTSEYVANIEGLYESQKGVWIITFAATENDNTSCREQFLHSTEGRISTAEDNITVSLPNEAPVRISIRGIPGETTYNKAVAKINQLGCGKVRNAVKNCHRGTSIHNGYISFSMENFKKDRLPDYVVIDGFRCKTFLPRELYVPTCGRCLQSGHIYTECESDAVCRYCKETGHIQKDCPAKKSDFPSLLGPAWTVPRRIRAQISQPINVQQTRQPKEKSSDYQIVSHPTENQLDLQSTNQNAAQPAITRKLDLQNKNDQKAAQPAMTKNLDIQIPGKQKVAQPTISKKLGRQITKEQNAAQPAATQLPDRDTTDDENAAQPATPRDSDSKSVHEQNVAQPSPELNQALLFSDVHEFSLSSESTDLKEISNWSECEDAGSVISSLATPPNQPQSKPTRQSSRLKPSSTIGSTPFHPPSKGNAYVKVMVHNIEARDSSASSVFDVTPDETTSAPAILEYQKEKPTNMELNASNTNKPDYKRSREETTSSESSTSIRNTSNAKTTGKKKNRKRERLGNNTSKESFED